MILIIAFILGVILAVSQLFMEKKRFANLEKEFIRNEKVFKSFNKKRIESLAKIIKNKLQTDDNEKIKISNGYNLLSDQITDCKYNLEKEAFSAPVISRKNQENYSFLLIAIRAESINKIDNQYGKFKRMFASV